MYLKKFNRGKEDKKGITIQLSWIYVLIAGAVILILFSRIIVFVQDAGAKTISDNIRDQLDDAFVKIRADRLFFQQLQTPKDFDLERCEFGKMYYQIGKSSLEATGIYSPSEVKPSREQLLLWTLPWEVPYWVDNMLYLTSEEVLYVFIQDKQGYLDDILYDPTYGLPANVSRVVIPNTEFEQYLGGDVHVFDEIIDELDFFYKVKFIMFDAASDYGEITPEGAVRLDLTFPNEIMRKTDTAINVLPRKGGIDGVGQIQFFDVVGKEFTIGRKLPYLGRPLIFAAIFGQDAQQYECNLHYFMQRFRDVTLFTMERLTFIYDLYPTTDECSYYIDAAFNLEEDSQNVFGVYLNHIDAAIQELRTANLFKTDEANSLYGKFNQTYDMSIQISEKNKKLVRYQYCAGVY